MTSSYFPYVQPAPTSPFSLTYAVTIGCVIDGGLRNSRCSELNIMKTQIDCYHRISFLYDTMVSCDLSFPASAVALLFTIDSRNILQRPSKQSDCLGISPVTPAYILSKIPFHMDHDTPIHTRGHREACRLQHSQLFNSRGQQASRALQIPDPNQDPLSHPPPLRPFRQPPSA